jgi:hypothetical protein
MHHTHYSEDDTVKVFVASEKRVIWGMLSINDKRYEAVDLLLPYFATILYQGTTGVAKAIRIKDDTMDALMELAIEEADITHFKNVYEIADDALCLMTPIDVNNLRAYLSKCRSRLDRDTLDAKAKRKILREVTIGTTILTSLNVTNSLCQESTIADSGRVYLKGLNLQTSPKNLRHAALGNCHLYDMRVGSFGVMAALASTYAERNGLQAKFSHIRAYIKHKDKFRMKITEFVYPEQTKNFKSITDFKQFFGFYNIKQALTSIGFGAKRSASAVWRSPDGKWNKTSLLECFKSNKQEAQSFLDCVLCKALIDEYQEASAIVLLMLEQDQSFSAKFNFANAESPAQKSALVYQHIESELLNQVVKLSGQTVLLPVHDGVYLRHSIDYQNVWSQLTHDYISDFTFIQFDHLQYLGETHVGDPINDEISHRAQIIEQEELAKDYVPVLATIDGKITKRQVMTPWGMMDADLYEPHQTVAKSEDYFIGTY